MLPKIPYSMQKNKSMTVPIGNLNFSSNFKPGDIADSYGISARQFPRLTNNKAKELTYQGGKILGMTVFNGEIVTVRATGDEDAEIYAGDNKVASLSGDYPRRLAVINTKLVVYPDKVYIEKKDGRWNSNNLEASLTILNPVFSSNAILTGTGEEIASGRCGEFDSTNKCFSLYQPSFKLTEKLFVSVAGGLGGSYISLNREFTECLDVKLSEEEYNQTIMYLPSSVDLSQIPTTTNIYWMDNQGISQSIVEISKDYNYANVNEDQFVYKCKIGGSGYYSSPPNRFFLQMEFDNAQLQQIRLAKRCYIKGLKIGGTSYTSILGSDGALIESSRIYFSGFYVDADVESGMFEIASISLSSWDDNALEGVSPGDLIFVVGSQSNGYSLKVKYTEPEVIYFDETDPSTQSIMNEKIEGDITLWKMGKLPNIAFKFKVGDTVTISGAKNEKNNISFTISKISAGSIHASADIFTSEHYPSITIDRKVPELDFICERDNRIYGVNKAEKTVYVSALGDPTNMYAYEGVSTDSFAVAVGGEGDFTGCCNYGEAVLFFKEDKIYKLTGYTPADFALNSYNVDGLEMGSEKSLVVINEVLYYKGRNGIFAYAGGIPTLISDNFGEKNSTFVEASAGTDGVNYYLIMYSDNDMTRLFCYNTRLGIWTQEDKTEDPLYGFVRTPDGLYIADENGNIYRMNASNPPSDCTWMTQFTPFYETVEGKKIYSRLLLRAELPRGSYMIIEVRSDDGAWCEAGKIVGVNKGIIPIRLPISRCDKFEIRLRGKGEFVLHEILREYHVGSEV